MFATSRFTLIFVIAALFTALTTGCAGINVANPVASVDAQTVTAQMQYVDGSEVGPLYNMSVTVPAEWVGTFETRSEGNTLYFDFVTESGTPAQIFFIEALSPSQYWNQAGAHPGSYVNIVNRGDTFFIYYLPIDSYYSGLSKEQFTPFAEAVPGIIASFDASATN